MNALAERGAHIIRDCTAAMNIDDKSNSRSKSICACASLGIPVLQKMVALNADAQNAMATGRFSQITVGIDLINNRFIVTEQYKDGVTHVDYVPIFDGNNQNSEVVSNGT